jgi:hypothetical protein
MLDANGFPWTSVKASAAEVAYGPVNDPCWQAPMPFESVAANKTAPAALAVHAHINHGRWIVQCPDCAGAQMACPDDRRFMCNYCGNALLDSLWRPVVWPKNKAAIEEILMLRKLPNQRNWLPHESHADLKAENEERGVVA